mgnify:CR=1 FL=1
MKKTFFLIVLLLLISTTVFAASGDIAGSYVHTDIEAYINGKLINSYNINGWTGIVAEDLASFGFDVRWDAAERTLSVEKYYESTPDVGVSVYNLPCIKMPVGSFAGYIYETDIKTYVAGDEVTAFNIGGRTIIFIDELIRFGNVTWYENERKVCYDYVEPWSIDLYEVNYEADTTKEISSFSLEMTKGESGECLTTGENLDYLTYPRLSYNKKEGMCFGFSIYQRVLFQTEEIYKILLDISNVGYDGEILSEDTNAANNHMKILINGEPAKITKVTQGKGNGHMDFYFWLDCDVKKEDISSVQISFN